MEWMSRTPERRKDPREVLPGRPVHHHRGPELLSGKSTPPSSGHGQIARYAWGDDYHALLDGKLTDLCHYLETWGGTQKLYADTVPILERDWASAAGLGWNGKSTVQIHPGWVAIFFWPKS